VSKKKKAKKPVTLATARMPDGLIHHVQQEKQGAWRLERQEKDGPKLAVNKTASPLRMMAFHGAITTQMREAGEAFGGEYRIAYSIAGSDVMAKAAAGGGITHETERAALRITRARAALHEIGRKCSKAAWLRLMDVCVSELYMGETRRHAEAYARLIEGLLVTAAVLGIPMSREN
jgi:hypothetical protein